MDNLCGLLNSRSQSLKSSASGCVKPEEMRRSLCGRYSISLFLPSKRRETT